MANVNGITSGSPLAFTPLTIQLQAGTFSGNISFHRLKYQVVVESEGVANTASENSQPVVNGEIINVDISSAIIAHTYQFTYSATELQFPLMRWQLCVWDEYILNGQIMQSAKKYSKWYVSICGKLTDRERIVSSELLSELPRLSRKPKSVPEIFPAHKTYVYAAPYSLTGVPEYTEGMSAPLSHTIMYDTLGMHTLPDGRSIYIVSDDEHRYTFRFINSLGIMETVSVYSLPNTETEITSETFNIARFETLNTFSHTRIAKRNDYETWKFSTGPLDKQWQQWYIHEFLMSETCWIYIDDIWLPCHILSEDTISTGSKTDGKPLEVAFSVRLDIFGSPYSFNTL